ncbi:TPA: virulence protein [Salmonella enterica subsp. enterica serovar Choleraesuis]|uniref:Virulence protein n=5 Tax=Salmonella enterica TaxID=28901 RepID=A0A712BWI8_SALET|nr:virulence effector protease GtgE [Salmonella enterica]EAA9667464.1 virulence protein [Salmonella enterica subsp. enterica serovar Infantis]EEB1771942.1 virulence protein [Salmonella enterica subsp. enterica serovar Enteritidis]EHD3289216.1 virulence protein [Salmonella enterica subsp. enterica serovar 6,7,[14]:-:1,5]AAX64914.1 Gifsy-2 prophage protein [Salmonella enterica subsp. enterica serovar Choleraesuis str. SC-B67]EAO2817876.1 virulence protein [Salmonella enterica]
MLRHIQNSLGSVYRSNTATPQGQIIHHRNFQSQFDTTGNTLYNNCWVCSLNVIKSRDGNNYSALEDITSDNQAFNNILEGIDIIECENLLKEMNVQKIPESSLFTNIKEALQAEVFNSTVEDDFESFISYELQNHGPLMLIRPSLGSECIHAECIVGYDSEVKKVLIYDSMNTSPEWQSNIDVYDKLTLAFNDKYKNEDCSICGLYYDGVYEPKPLHSSSWKDWCTIL